MALKLQEKYIAWGEVWVWCWS